MQAFFDSGASTTVLLPTFDSGAADDIVGAVATYPYLQYDAPVIASNSVEAYITLTTEVSFANAVGTETITFVVEIKYCSAVWPAAAKPV